MVLLPMRTSFYGNGLWNKRNHLLTLCCSIQVFHHKMTIYFANNEDLSCVASRYLFRQHASTDKWKIGWIGWLLKRSKLYFMGILMEDHLSVNSSYHRDHFEVYLFIYSLIKNHHQGYRTI